MSGSMLPPDLRAQAEARTQTGNRGIGGAARENSAQSAARASAMGVSVEEAAAAQQEKAEEPQKTVDLTECPVCKKKPGKDDLFCAGCGQGLLQEKDPIKFLAIKPFTDEDVDDYIFKGFILREIPILGKHKIILKSSQPKDLKAVDSWLMNGEYKDKGLSNALYKQLHLMGSTASAVEALDAQSIGETLEKRITWLEERGSALVDMLTDRVVIFNRAWTRYLQEKNPISGS